MGGHEVGHQILLFSQILSDAVELILKLVVGLNGGLAHQLQHVVGAMLGSHLQLSADVICHDLAEEGVVCIR